MLKARFLLILATCFGFGAILTPACRSQNDTGSRSVQGALNTAQFSLRDAQVIAVATSGHTVRAPLAADGSFQVTLVVGERYQLRFANSTSTDGIYDAFAVLALQGGQRHVFDVVAGPPVELGRVGLLGTVRTTKTLTAATSGGNDDDADDDEMDDNDDGDDQDGQHDDDVDQVCDLSGGADMADVEAENDPTGEICDCEDGDALRTRSSDDDDGDDDDMTDSSTVSDDDDDMASDHDSNDDADDDDIDQPCDQGPQNGEGGDTTPVPGGV